MVFVILQSRVVDKVDIACVGVGLEGGNKVFMNGVVVAVYPAYPPIISSRQCLRITASTCLLRVIIDYQYCRHGSMPADGEYVAGAVLVHS